MTTFHPDHFSSSPARQRIAVVGGGVAGLSAAWLLSLRHDVVLFEKAEKAGGHANTVMVPTAGKDIPVDAGFIVYNDANYPNLVALFDYLGVETQDSCMSFAVSMNKGSLEYASGGIHRLIGRAGNVIQPRFWRMLRDIMRLYREAGSYMQRDDLEQVSLGQFLDELGYSRAFQDYHLYPMCAAIWSCPVAKVQDYPVVSFLRFFANHGLMQYADRPQWRTVTGGSQEYVQQLLAAFRGEVRVNSAVARVVRLGGGVQVATSDGHIERFDHVVLASHGDEALAMLAQPSDRERAILGAFQYTANTAYLHKDTSLMPRSRRVWSSWNYVGHDGAVRGMEGEHLCVSYWMNRLQNLDTRENIFVTLNPQRPPAEALTHQVFEYDHPVFDQAAVRAQRDIWDIQGQGGVWYCGAHLGAGFHEDGLQAGLAVAEMLGNVRRPWALDNPSSRLHIPTPSLARAA